MQLSPGCALYRRRNDVPQTTEAAIKALRDNPYEPSAGPSGLKIMSACDSSRSSCPLLTKIRPAALTLPARGCGSVGGYFLRYLIEDQITALIELPGFLEPFFPPAFRRTRRPCLTIGSARQHRCAKLPLPLRIVGSCCKAGLCRQARPCGQGN